MGHRQKGKGKKRSKAWHRGAGESRQWKAAMRRWKKAAPSGRHVCAYTLPEGSEPTVTEDDGTVWCSTCPTILAPGQDAHFGSTEQAPS